jgi:transposase
VVVFSSHHEYYIYTVAVDMRNGIDGLCGLITNELDCNPNDGKVYIFFNRPRDKVKMLIWDKDGYVMYLKRLEKGKFEQILKQDQETKKYNIKYNHLVMLLSGISLVGLKQRPRYLLT